MRVALFCDDRKPIFDRDDPSNALGRFNHPSLRGFVGNTAKENDSALKYIDLDTSRHYRTVCNEQVSKALCIR